MGFSFYKKLKDYQTFYLKLEPWFRLR